MESNKDEADKCLELALRFIRQGQKEKAEKFVRKAERLYPSSRIQEVLNLIQNMSDPGGDDGSGGSAPSTPNKGKGSNDDEATTSSAEYTQEQLDSVRKIRRCKNYYEILSVEKDSSESDLKKAYRKLALGFHPDKNKAPGAGEAFKAIGNAYAVLSNPEKKRQYDLYGDEAEISGRGRGRGNYEQEDPSYGFQGDMTAEEIFNMFFGGGMPGGNVYVRRGGMWQRQAEQRQHREQHQTDHHSHNGGDSGTSFSALFQLMPILILLVVSLLSSFLAADPLYSLDPSHKYSVQMKTKNLAVSYYVKETFRSEFSGSRRKLEKQIEEDYISHLRNACFREKAYKENLLWQARYSGNNILLRKAQDYPVPNCNSLEQIYAGR